MSTDERQQLTAAISALEGQRAVLGDAVVDAALGPMRERLARLASLDAPPPPAPAATCSPPSAPTAHARTMHLAAAG